MKIRSGIKIVNQGFLGRPIRNSSHVSVVNVPNLNLILQMWMEIRRVFFNIQVGWKQVNCGYAE